MSEDPHAGGADEAEEQLEPTEDEQEESEPEPSEPESSELATPGKKEYASTVEQGTAFEKQVADLMKSYGYKVTHNVTLVGASGNTHQIDVFAEYECPMHTTKIIVETKSYKNNLSKEIVMKLMREMVDLGVDRTILATTSDFSIGAKKEAAMYGTIDMWNGDKIKEFMANKGIDTSDSGVLGVDKRFVVSKVKPKYISRYAAKSAKKRSGGVLFGRGRSKEHVAGANLVCYPYLDVSIQTRVSKVEKTGWRKKENIVRTVVSHVTLDGRTGALVDFGKKGISYRFSYLGGIGKDEMAILRKAAGKPTFGKDEIVLAELSASAANAAILKMASRGIIKQVSEKPVKYSRIAPVPKTPSHVTGIDKVYGSNMLDSSPGNRIIDLQVSVGAIEERLGKIWPGCKVISTEQTYYPYYDVRYESEDGGTRNEVIDGITGRPQRYLTDVMADVVQQPARDTPEPGVVDQE